MMCFDPISYDKAEKARKHSENVQEQLNQHKLNYIEENLLKQQVVLELSDGTKNEFTINEQGNYEMTVNLGWCRLKDLEYHETRTRINVDEIRYRRPVDMIKGALTSIMDIANMEEVEGATDLIHNVGKYTTAGTTDFIQFVVSKGTTREDFESNINMDSLVIYKLADPYTVVMPDNISANTKELIRLSIKSKEIASDLSAHKEDYENQFPITNLVRMELEDWIPGDSTNTITGNTIINKSNPTVSHYARAISKNKSIPGNVYYGRVTLKVNTEDCTRIALTLNNSLTGQNYVDDPEMGVLYTLSGVHKAEMSAQPLITVGHLYDTPSSEHTMEIKDVISINLTEVFGAGNEPTKQEADEMFSSLNWFEGKLNWKETFKVLSKKSTLITPDSIRNKDGLGQSPYLRNYKIIEFDHSKWVATSDTPSLTIETDREFVKFGYDSLKVVAHPTETTIIEYTFDKPIDLSNKYMNLWVYIPNNMMKNSQEIKFSTIAIYFMTPQGWVSQWQDRGYHRYEGMQPIVASPHTLNHNSAGGNGDMTQVSKIRIRIQKDPTNTEPVELYINAMSTYDFVNEHYMSIEFDDALPSVFNVAFPEMNRRGIRGGVWVITSHMKAGMDGCKPWQLLKMQDAGWDVGSHSVTHRHLSELTEEEQLYELKQSQQDLIDIGIYRGPQFFVAPYGDSTLYSRKMAKTIYANWRMTGWRIGNGVILEDPYLREGVTIASRGVEGTKALIDDLVAKPGGYLPIVAHGEIGGTFDGYSFTAEEFGEILDYALSKGVKFITNSDMFPNTEIRR